MATAGGEGTRAPQLRPLRIGEILDVAIRICIRHWRPLVMAVLVVVVPVQLVATVVTASTIPDESDPLFQGPAGEPGARPQAFEFSDDAWAFLGGQAVVALLTIVMTTLATAACFKVVADAYLGAQPDWRRSLRVALGLLAPLLWLTVLALLGLIPAFLLLIVPGIWLAVRWAVAVPALLVEDARGGQALARSFRLVGGRWWPTFAALLVGVLLATIVGGVLGALVAVPIRLAAGDDVLVNVIADGIGSTLGALVTTPFQAAIVALVYFDLRVRKEGFDLELLAERMGTRPDAAASPARTTAGDDADDQGEGPERPPYWPPPPDWRSSSGASAGE